MEEYVENSYKKPLHLPGIFVSVIFFLVLSIFEIMLAKTNFLPEKYLYLLTAILIVIVLAVGLLVWDFHKRIRFCVGALLAILMTCGFALGGSYLQKTTETLGTITATKTEISQVAVFVKTENTAETLEDIQDVTFGILETLDRANTDQAVVKINEKLGKDISVKIYAGLGEVIDGILNDEIGAMVLNQAYLDIVSEMEGYENTSEQVRVLDIINVETVKVQRSAVVTENQSKDVEKISEVASEESSDETVTEDSSADKIPTEENVSNETEASENDESTVETEDVITETETVDETTETDADVKDDKNTSNASDKKGEVISVYISGIDTYGSVSTKSRSDVNIIATIHTGTKQVLLVSTPRDYFVPLSISNGIPDKLTHAGIYGIDVSKDTLGMLYGIDVPYYFRVNFSGFSGIIDALGGVTVNSEFDFNAGGYSYHVGENYLNGAQALAFARERYSFSSGDRQRGKNQMAVIKAVINKAMSPELLKNFTSIMKAVEGSFETSIPLTTITSLVRAQLSDGGDWNIVTYSVDGTGSTQRPYSMSQNAYVMIPDQATVDKAKELMRQVRDGEVITP